MIEELPLALPDALLRQILDHAQAGYPEEICGLISGKGAAGGGVAPLAVHAGRNISPTPAVAYELDHETLALQIAWEEQGLALWGIYHSHPQGPETPSETDASLAFYPEAVYIIVSLAEREQPIVRGFLISASSGAS